MSMNEHARRVYSGSQLCANLQTHHPASSLRRAVLLKCNPFCGVTAEEFDPAAERALCHRFSSRSVCVYVYVYVCAVLCLISLRLSSESEWVSEWVRALWSAAVKPEQQLYTPTSLKGAEHFMLRRQILPRSLDAVRRWRVRCRDAHAQNLRNR